jgi:hypothetical protein
MGAAEDFFASLTPERIERLISNQEPESVHHDYISYLGYKIQSKGFDFGVDNIAKPISAFANTDGGVILYGLHTVPAENPKRDLPDRWEEPPANFAEAIVAVARDRISPAIVNLAVKRIEHPSDLGKAVTAILVPRSGIPPHQTTDKFVYFHRVGDTTKEMSHDLLELTFRARHAAELNVFPVLSPKEAPVAISVGELCFEVTNLGNSPAINVEVSMISAGVARKARAHRGILGVGETFVARWATSVVCDVPSHVCMAHLANQALEVRIGYSDLGGSSYEVTMPFTNVGPSSACFVRPLRLSRNGRVVVS